MLRRRRDRHGGEDPVGKARRPLQHLHAAHRAADDAEQRVDAEVIDQHGLGAHHVADGDDRQIEAIGRPVAGLTEAGPVVPMQPPTTFEADHKEAVGVDRPARPDHRLPPAGLARDRVPVGDMLVAGQRMADEDGVGFLRVELAIRLIGDSERREPCAGIEFEHPVGAEPHDRLCGASASSRLAALGGERIVTGPAGFVRYCERRVRYIEVARSFCQGYGRPARAARAHPRRVSFLCLASARRL